jgi:hypothetical protein
LKEEMFLPLCQWGMLVVRCWNSNITTGVNYCNLYLSFINFKQTWYVICSSRKLSFGWCWDAVACKPIRNTLRFTRLIRWESETEDGIKLPFETKRSGLWTLSSFVEFFTKWNNWNKFRTFRRQQELHTRSDKWDNLFITMATAKHTL